MKKIVLLFNPSSGKGRSLKQKKKIQRCLEEKGIDFDLLVTGSEDHLRLLAGEKAKEYEMIVGVGGDTTFNIIAGEVLKCRESIPVLGMIGTGSANDIVRGLGINSIEDACEAIKQGKTREMDVGCVKIPGPHFFLGTLSLGLGTTVNRYVEGFLKRHPRLSKLKPFDQLLPGIYAIHHSFAKKKVPLTVEMLYNEPGEGETFIKNLEFSLLVFLNTPYYASGLKLGQDNGLFDGVLDCCVIHSKSFLNTFLTGMRVQKGKHIGREEVILLQAASFKISSRGAMDIQVDGEIIEGVRELEVSVLPGALRVLSNHSNI